MKYNKKINQILSFKKLTFKIEMYFVKINYTLR